MCCGEKMTKQRGCNVFVATPRTLHMLEHWLKHYCKRCNVLFEVGDEIVSKYGPTHNTPYHKRCFKELFF